MILKYKNLKILKYYLNDLYNQGKLTFVTLVGSPEYIPFLRGKYENAPSDQDFVRFTDDNFPDAFISRFSASNVFEANAMIQKTIKYEKFPEIDGDWYKSTLAIASNEGEIQDFRYARDLNKALKYDFGYQNFWEAFQYCYKALDGGDGFFLPFNKNKASKSIVFDALNTGVNVINYIGHGTNTSWYTTRFDVNDVKTLNNGMRLPVIWSVACVNGNYTIDECFAESWQRHGDENGGGALGIAAATTNMSWVPPIQWQKEIIKEQMINNQRKKGAVLNLYGMAKTAQLYGMNDFEEGNRLIEQVVYFGEGSTPIRTEKPQFIDVNTEIKNGKIKFFISGQNVENILISTYTINLESERTNIATVLSDINGFCEFDYNDQTHYTVSGNNIYPLHDITIK